MERPQSVLGLTRHYLEMRWQGLSRRGRILTVAALVTLSFASVSFARMALGCHGSCAARRAHEAAIAAGATDCPHHAN